MPNFFASACSSASVSVSLSPSLSPSVSPSISPSLSLGLQTLYTDFWGATFGGVIQDVIMMGGLVPFPR